MENLVEDKYGDYTIKPKAKFFTSKFADDHLSRQPKIWEVLQEWEVVNIM